ncbi:MAG: FecR family protein [Agriterribacter sp.]
MKCYWDKLSGFTEEEFAADEYFQQWVLIPDDENETFWKSFIEQYPAQRIPINNARKLVEHLADTGFHVPNLSGEEKQSLKESIFQKLNLPPAPAIPAEPEVKYISTNKTTWLWAAAAVVGLLVAAFFFLNKPTQPGAPLLAMQKTAARQVKEILLPDSSVIILNGNSSIQYSNQFNESAIREVFLEGNAYFKIKKTTGNKPFVVRTSQVSINVTGTEFNVDARTKATDIVLTSGLVNVTMAQDSLHKTRLNAGEKLTLDTVKQQLITKKADTQLYTAAWEKGEWHFEETTLETVASLIKQFYGTEVIFEKEESRKLMITAVVSVKDFATLIHVIEKTLNVTIHETETKLFIH